MAPFVEKIGTCTSSFIILLEKYTISSLKTNFSVYLLNSTSIGLPLFKNTPNCKPLTLQSSVKFFVLSFASSKDSQVFTFLRLLAFIIPTNPTALNMYSGLFFTLLIASHSSHQLKLHSFSKN